MKKYSILFVFLLLSVAFANAQMLRFGLKAGVNFANLTGGDLEGYDFKTITNFHGGVVMELKLIDKLSIQPEVLYSTQGAEVEGLGEQFKNELGYLSIPVMAKIYLGGDKLSLQAGPQVSFLLSERSDFEVSDAETFDFSVGAGLEYKFTDNIFIQGRYLAGLTEANQDAEVKNSVIQFSFGFMF